MPTPMIDAQGVVHDVPDEHVASRTAIGWRPQSFDDVLAASTDAARQEAYGGIGGGLKAASAAALRGASLGLSDVAARALGGEDAAIGLEGLRAENPGISFAGELGGAIAPALITGGAGLARGIGAAAEGLGARTSALGAERLGAGLARAGAGVSELGAEGGALSRIGESAIGRAAEYVPSSLVGSLGGRVSEVVGGGLRGALASGATEGAIYGAGQGVSELALEPDPLTWERAASTIGSNALFGAGAGAGLGLAGNAVERGLRSASEAIDAAVARSAAQGKVAAASSIPEYEAIRSQVESVSMLAEMRDGSRAIFKPEPTPNAKPPAGAGGAEEAATGRPQRSPGPSGYVEQTLPASELAERGYYERPGAHVDPVRVTDARAAVAAGLADPVTLSVSPTGRVVVESGRHQLDAAIDLDKPVNVRWSTGEEPGAGLVHRAGPVADVSGLSAADLRKAEKAELDRLRTKQVPHRQAFVDELDVYRNANRDAHAMREAPKASTDRNIKEAGGAFATNDFKLRGLLDDRVGLAEDPQRAMVLLRKQRQALEEIVPWAQEQRRLWQQDAAEAPAKIRAALKDVSSQPTLEARQALAEKYGLGISEELGPFTEAGLDAASERVLKENASLSWAGSDRAGLKEPPASKLVKDYEKLLAWNARFSARLEDLAKPPTSELLTRISAARDALGAPKPPPSAGQAVFNAVAPFAGPMGVAAAAGGRLLGGVKKLVGNVVEKTAKSVSAILDTAAKGVKIGTPYAPVLATKTLAALRYGSGKHDKEPETLPELYKARTDEIKQLTAYDATGTPVLRPEVRQQIGAKLRPIAAVDPVMADRIETALAARIEYLSSIIPRRPDIAGISTGPDKWQPSDMAMRSWARSAAAAEDPYAVLERAVHGAVTPEDARTMQAVHPEILADFTHRVTSQLPTLRETLPYDRQLSLSILTGVPVAAALDPKILKVLQGQFPDEPGSAGGTQAPKAAPQFGSISKSISQPTPAQSRAQGAHV